MSNYWIEAIDGAVILFALFLARIVGGESTAETVMRLLRIGDPGRERPAVLDDAGVARDLSGLIADATSAPGSSPAAGWPSSPRRSRTRPRRAALPPAP